MIGGARPPAVGVALECIDAYRERWTSSSENTVHQVNKPYWRAIQNLGDVLSSCKSLHALLYNAHASMLSYICRSVLMVYPKREKEVTVIDVIPSVADSLRVHPTGLVAVPPLCILSPATISSYQTENDKFNSCASAIHQSAQSARETNAQRANS
ncbi:hypothetical protein CBL_12896 [Carabus blaptoides fortunei]